MTVKAVKIITSNHIPFIEVIDLSNKDTLDKIKGFMLYVIADSDRGSALKLSNKLKLLLDTGDIKKQLDDYLVNEYKNQVILADFIALAELSDQEIEQLFRTKVIYSIRNGIDILH